MNKNAFLHIFSISIFSFFWVGCIFMITFIFYKEGNLGPGKYKQRRKVSCLQVNQWQKLGTKNPGFKINYYREQTSSNLNPHLHREIFLWLKCYSTSVLPSMTTLHGWFCMLQGIYQLPTHKNLCSIPPSHDTHKMSFTSKSP